MEDRALEVLAALANALRLQIVAALCERPDHVSGLARRVRAPPWAVSQALARLRLRGLVARSRRAGFARYEIAETGLRCLVRFAERLKG